mgnify:CR=1 FL=1
MCAVISKPEFKEAYNAAYHGLFSLGSGWEVDFDVVFEYIWINPEKELASRIEEDHVFVDDEVPVRWSEVNASLDDCLGI